MIILRPLVSDPNLPPRVQRFLKQHIDSIEKLEVLLLLRANPSRPWTAAAVAGELRIMETSAAGRLEDLTVRGLLADEGGTPPSFRYAPHTGEDAQAVTELASTYAQRRVSVITFIFSQPQDQLRSFANAFRLRKD
jgi:predicted ArsR family transcriptional regulator